MKAGSLPVALLAGLAALQASPAIGGGRDPRIDDLPARLLAAHNRERVGLGIAPLAWSEALATHARAWAGRLAAMRGLAHEPDSPGMEPEGENLWAGTRGHYSLEQMVGYWTTERARYRPGRFPDVSLTGRLEQVGHYTQIVWRSTRTVGCAVADNGEDEFLVCRYAEAGNVIGETPY